MAETPITVFYDGHCGLCHGLVRFLIASDPGGSRFDYAPLQGEYCATVIPQAQRQRLPDSVVVRTHDRQLLVKAAAVLYVLMRIGGPWHALGIALNWLPPALLDFAYDGIARLRRRLFTTPTTICPLVPPDLQHRFHL